MDLYQLLELGQKYLEVEFPITQEEFKIAYRSASKKYHPDTGGSTGHFKVLNSVYEEIGKQPANTVFFMGDIFVKPSEATEIITCADCQGKGKTEDIIQGKVIRVWKCEECRGTGKISKKKLDILNADFRRWNNDQRVSRQEMKKKEGRRGREHLFANIRNNNTFRG